ncbi:DUF1667 domain-containing protein [Haloimpatiens sp. FM7330]|uniref:DUF1667 domain-containing protein n=1 Tax=Haloimpatiens sp. FM7330 TaxID=3298610 RepID=UPI00362F7008
MKVITCIGCPNSCKITIKELDGKLIIEGNKCKKGREFAINEIKNPKRSLCTTVKTIFENFPRISVRTNGEIPKELISRAMEIINKIVIHKPVNCGEIIIENILDTQIDVIATEDLQQLLEGKFSEEVCFKH